MTLTAAIACGLMFSGALFAFMARYDVIAFLCVFGFIVTVGYFLARLP